MLGAEGVEPYEKGVTRGVGEESVIESIAIEKEEFSAGQAHVESVGIFVEERGFEHRRIISGKSDGNAVAEKLDERMVCEAGVRGVELNIESVGTEIASGADFERNFSLGEGVHERGAADSSDTVADAFNAENIESVLDLLRAAGLPSVGEAMEAVISGEFVNAAEV